MRLAYRMRLILKVKGVRLNEHENPFYTYLNPDVVYEMRTTSSALQQIICMRLAYRMRLILKVKGAVE